MSSLPAPDCAGPTRRGRVRAIEIAALVLSVSLCAGRGAAQQLSGTDAEPRDSIADQAHGKPKQGAKGTDRPAEQQGRSASPPEEAEPESAPAEEGSAEQGPEATDDSAPLLGPDDPAGSPSERAPALPARAELPAAESGASESPPPAAPTDSVPRRLELGAAAGLGFRQSNAAAVADYGVGRQWGGFARVEVQPWLYIRLSATTELLEAELAPDFAVLEVTQPRLRGTRIGLLVEPSWQLGAGWATWLTLGAVWERLSATAFESVPRWASVPRSGVFLELPVGLGLSADLVPQRLRVSVLAHWTIIANQTGDLFQASQAIDDTGQLAELPALPTLRGSLGTSLFLGVLL